MNDKEIIKTIINEKSPQVVYEKTAIYADYLEEVGRGAEAAALRLLLYIKKEHLDYAKNELESKVLQIATNIKNNEAKFKRSAAKYFINYLKDFSINNIISGIKTLLNLYFGHKEESLIANIRAILRADYTKYMRVDTSLLNDLNLFLTSNLYYSGSGDLSARYQRDILPKAKDINLALDFLEQKKKEEKNVKKKSIKESIKIKIKTKT